MSDPKPGGIAQVLLVDDDPLLLRMAAHTLRHAGFGVREAASGEAALAAFEQGGHDLVVLDVMMPGLDGYEVCGRIRCMPGGARVPVLMLTGLDDTSSIELAYAAGATDFIAKPINWTLLGHRVRYALRAGEAIESALRNHERLERAQQIAQLGSWELADASFSCSIELLRLYGLEAEHDDLSLAAFNDRIADHDRGTVSAARDAALRDGLPYRLTFQVQHRDRSLRTVFEEASPVRDAGGRIVAIEGITQDVTARVEAERSIRRLARYDALTGLPNRMHAAELCDAVLERLARHGQRSAMLHVDVDRFKSVNDAYGHAQGDTLLRTLAGRLQHLLAGLPRHDDSLVGRVGPNAFGIVLAPVDDERQVSAFATRLLEVIGKPVSLGGGEILLSASIGIALAPRDAAEATGLARCAEQALYAAKAAGRASFRFFDEAMNAEASAQLAREHDLRRAIAEGQLRLHYQPKVDATTGRIVGAEALVRWMHPQRGLVPPGEFIALAEESGLILPLTDWVLETACSDLRRRLDAGLPPVPVSVNLSAPSFAHDGLLAQLQALTARHRIAPELLTLEVTESLLMSDADRAAARLTELRAHGYSVSLDDFGTGYSSLSYLKRFPIDELKIDRSFVTDVARGGRDGALAASIIALGREFGLRVIAEGVETAEQASFLIGHGCVYQQGFLFARPVPPAELEALMRRGHLMLAPPVPTVATPLRLPPSPLQA